MERLVQFKDGKRSYLIINLVYGACLVGDPTAFVYRQVGSKMIRVYVKPGESCSFVEVESSHAASR